MPKISELPSSDLITGAEAVAVVQDGVTKQTLVKDLRPYKLYTALLTQSGTDAPVATVLENTLEFNPSWEYFEPGKYGFNFPTPPDYNKIVVLIGPANDYTTHYNVNTDYNILVRSNGNDFLVNNPVEIRVYN